MRGFSPLHPPLAHLDRSKAECQNFRAPGHTGDIHTKRVYIGMNTSFLNICHMKTS